MAASNPLSEKNTQQTIKTAFREAFIALQRHPDLNLLEWAMRNPDDFYKIAAKMIPQEIEQSGAVTLQVVTGVPTIDVSPKPEALPMARSQELEANGWEEIA